MLGTASAAPHKSVVDEDALARAIAFETALTDVAQSVSPSVVSIQVEVTRPQNEGLPFFFGGPRPWGHRSRRRLGRHFASGRLHPHEQPRRPRSKPYRSTAKERKELSRFGRRRGFGYGPRYAQDRCEGLPPAEFASSDKARVGQFVIAIGSPFGLDYTVTTGVLSAKGRGGIGANEIEDYLQTDASINPGNSGGPLVNLHGRVLGINTMIIGRGSGIGFAIPSEIAQRVARQLIENGTVKRAWLGVSFQEITPELAAHFGGNFDGGALINAVVPQGPADKAGLRAGDVITAVGGQKVQAGHDLLRAVLRHGVGERLSLEVRRGDKTKKFTLVTGERPSEDGAQSRQQGVQDDSMLGLALEDLTPRLRQRFRYEGDGRVFVNGVAPGSDADRAGLRPGDIILQADRQPVGSVSDVRAALKDGKALLYVERESRRFFQPITRSK